MRRFLAVILLVAATFGVASVAPPAAKAGGISFGIGIGLGYGYPVFRPHYYYPRRGYRRYYRPRRLYRPHRAYRAVRRRPVRRRRFSAAHYGYCSSKYRSYRSRDNTFQPYRGRRRQCRSRY